MRLTTSLTTAVLTLGASIAAAPLEVRQETLKDWQVSQVIWGGPSSRPGSSPFQILTVEVTDPNEINLGPSSADGKDVIVPAEPTFSCEATWFKEESPLGRTWRCSSGQYSPPRGYLVMHVLEGSDGTFTASDFNVKITHVAEVYSGSVISATYEATGNFGVSINLNTQCGNQGQCASSLRGDLKPFAIAPKKV